MPDASDSVDRLAERLRRLGVDAVLIGAQAANRYRAAARFTTDVDFLADDLGPIAASFQADGYEVRVIADPGEAPHALFVRGPDKVDLIAPTTEYQRVAMARAVDGVLTVEDVLVHKLIAWRTRDRDDIRSILEAGHPFDETYVRGWAEAWEVADRWTLSRSSG